MGKAQPKKIQTPTKSNESENHSVQENTEWNFEEQIRKEVEKQEQKFIVDEISFDSKKVVIQQKKPTETKRGKLFYSFGSYSRFFS